MEKRNYMPPKLEIELIEFNEEEVVMSSIGGCVDAYDLPDEEIGE